MKTQVARAEPSRGAPDAAQFLSRHGLADLSLHWPIGKPVPTVDYESGETAPTLDELLESYAKSRHVVLLEALRNALYVMNSRPQQGWDKWRNAVAEAEAAIKQAERT